MATSDEPPVNFSTFLVSLASSALAHLGQGDDPSAARDVALARHTVGLIEMLAVKTRGNLDGEEQRLLDTLQKELRDKLAAAPSA